jgi:RNA polymerase sigma factor (sigma-70 family)
MTAGPADTDIIGRVLKGEQNAYSVLVDRYRNFVFTIVLRYIPLREDAEEVAQDVFVKTYRSLTDFKGNSKFSTWLYTIATTTALSFLRKTKTVVHSLNSENIHQSAVNLNSHMTANQVETKSRSELVNNAIRLLNGEDAEIITLFYNAEQSIDEIARVLGILPNNVKIKLYRARTKLKEKMLQHYPAEIKDIYQP